VQKALDEIAKYSGTQFDPEVVKVFIAMPSSIWEDLRHQINSQIHRYTNPESLAKAGSSV